jgi:arginine decarboxylase
VGDSLREALDRASQRQRLHMPGHFGIVPPGGEGLPWALDQTEVEGLDSLSDPRAVLRGLAGRAAAAFGATHAWLSVQGATLPVMAGTLATAPHGSVIAADRIAHRSVLAAAVVGRYQVRWVAGIWDEHWQLWLPAPLGAWESALNGARLAIATVPTYEGLARSPAELAAAGHRRAVPLFVDAAHGSHWGRAPGLPPHVLAQGADLVAHGLHKTEPVLTQTGLLLTGAWNPGPRLEEWWRRLSTSSPSYPLLASIERYVTERAAGDGGWQAFAADMRDVWTMARRLGFRVLQAEWEEHGGVADPAKLTLMGDGPALAARLRGLGAEPESVGLASLTLIVGPSAGMDPQRWERLLAGLGPPPPARHHGALPAPGAMRLAPFEADLAGWRRIQLREAAGHVAARALTPYPPGIPAVLPGEEISACMRDWLAHHGEAGLHVEGLDPGAEGGTLWIVD